MLEVVLLGPDLVLDDERVRPAEVGDSAAVQLTVCTEHMVTGSAAVHQ
jgi:hypothetical protein